ncbi:MAG: hypothetical protein CMD23_01225 [Flavobacteriales bacterium]|nr:hypothetical protein [Flavobacteriales bacterium]|tara:strand:- start:6472 stop:8355 length:1884 start_codon:yes stop_codon:yes gene_type:complete
MKKLYLLLIIIAPFILKSQCTEGEYEILLQTTTGEWAEEMSWQIFDNQGNELLSFQGEDNDQEYSDVICLPAGCYAINASDSYGDGWNGGLLEVSSNDGIDLEFTETNDSFVSNESLFISPENGYGFYTLLSINYDLECQWTYVGCTDINASNYNSNAIIDDGSCYYPDCAEGETLVIIETQTGDWASEMTWDLYNYEDWTSPNPSATASFQGNNNYQNTTTQICLLSGCYMFMGVDLYGDGWQGGAIEMTINNQEYGPYEVEESFGYFTFEIDIKACNWEFPGCTDSSAYNYNEFATIDDGSCLSPLIFNWDKIDREYLLYMPPGIQENAPLVFVFHGYSGSAIDIMEYCGMNDIADENGFAVCYPQGTQDDWGNNFFNVGYDFQNNIEIDDVSFIVALAEYLQEIHQLSTVNTFSTGMSNGGDFSYLLACQASGTFRAIAPVAGTMMEEIYNNCNPIESVPIFETHGTDDDVTYYDGDPQNEDGWGVYLDIPTIIEYWVNQNNLSNLLIDTIPDNITWDNSIIERHIYSSENSTNEVWLYKVINGGHDWPGSWGGNMDVNISEEIWNFFNQMSLFDELSNLENKPNQPEKSLVNTIDVLGRKSINTGLQLHIYDDGSVEKKYIIK